MEHLEQADKHVAQHGQRRRATLAIQADLRQLDIPVAEFAPREIVNLLRGQAEVVILKVRAEMCIRDSLCGYLDKWMPKENTVLISAMMRDKETEKMCQRLAPRVRCVVCTQPNIPRAMPAEELARAFEAQMCIRDRFKRRAACYNKGTMGLCPKPHKGTRFP